MRKIYFTSILLGMMLAATSCEDDNKNYTDEFATVLHYKQEGIIEFDFYNVNKDMNYNRSVNGILASMVLPSYSLSPWV